MNKNEIIKVCKQLASKYEAAHSYESRICKSDIRVIESRKIDNKFHVVLTRNYNHLYHFSFDGDYNRYEMKVYLLSDAALYYHL